MKWSRQRRTLSCDDRSSVRIGVALSCFAAGAAGALTRPPVSESSAVPQPTADRQRADGRTHARSQRRIMTLFLLK